jgi:hypothetical protein
VAPEFGVREMSGGREMSSPCPCQVLVVPRCCSVVVWLLVAVEVGPTMTNDDCQSSFSCHVAVSDVAPAARVEKREGEGSQMTCPPRRVVIVVLCLNELVWDKQGTGDLLWCQKIHNDDERSFIHHRWVATWLWATWHPNPVLER